MAIVMTMVCCVLGVGVPLLTNGAEAKRTRDAAAFLAGQFRLARQRAVLTGRNVAVVFDTQPDDHEWRLCEDGDRDGVSRADITSQVDRCESPAQPLAFRFSGTAIGYAPDVPSPDGELGVAALRFGPAQMAVFTPLGTASAGTVAIRGPGGHQYAVRVSGVTGRTRILRYDPGAREWSE